MPDMIRDGQPYVFISYASADRERVLGIVDVLREVGIRCWLDQHDISGGANWGGSIADAIEGCAALTLMASATSLASRNVRQEIALAWQHEKPCVPLLLDTTPIPNDVAYWLATAQWIEVLHHPAETWLPKVTHALSLPGNTSSGPLAAPDRDEPRRSIASTHLPSPPSSFIGREREVAEIAALLHTERIVTLVGPGGIGKTRIAITVGHRLTYAFGDGVVFVDLAPLRDPALVVPTIAAVIGVQESGGIPLVETLASVLRTRHVLLILDNVEQVVTAASDISRLVTACPDIAVLATSREPLHIRGEVEYAIPSLPLPRADRHIDHERLPSNPAVALFLQRAHSANAHFDLTPENFDAIVSICVRLDGLPLAIELAAARTRLLTPQALSERLVEPLHLLTGGARDLPDRQRTIRDTIQWSYDLLAPEEQRLFRRLSVFVGGWTLTSAESVLTADGDLGIDLLDGVQSLLDKNLVVQRPPRDGDLSFSMLMMIREFGAQQLAQVGEDETVRAAHALFVSTLTEAATKAIGTAEETRWIARLDAERDNVRAALAWCEEVGDDASERAARGLRIAIGCWGMWDIHGRLSEATRWLLPFLQYGDALPPDVRIFATLHACYFMANLDHRERAVNLGEQALELAEALGDPRLRGHAMFHVSRSVSLRQPERALSLATQSLDLLHAAGDEFGVVMALSTLRRMAVAREDFPEALRLDTAQIDLLRRRDDQITLASGLNESGWLAYVVGDAARAEAVATEAVAVAQQNRYLVQEGCATALLSRLALDDGELRKAQTLAVASLDRLVRSASAWYLPAMLAPVAHVAIASGDLRLAARLLSVHVTYHGQQVDYLFPTRDYDTGLAHVKAALGDDAFERIQQEAQSMTLDDAVSEAVAAFTLNTSG